MKKQLELFQSEDITSTIENKIEDVEWCFQFFNNEPVVFAWGDEVSEPTSLILQIQPIEGQGLNFQQNGMGFQIFPRPISEETKLEREKSKETN